MNNVKGVFIVVGVFVRMAVCYFMVALVLPPLGGDILRLKMEVSKYTGVCVCAVSFLKHILSLFLNKKKKQNRHEWADFSVKCIYVYTYYFF